VGECVQGWGKLDHTNKNTCVRNNRERGKKAHPSREREPQSESKKKKIPTAFPPNFSNLAKMGKTAVFAFSPLGSSLSSALAIHQFGPRESQETCFEFLFRLLLFFLFWKHLSFIMDNDTSSSRGARRHRRTTSSELGNTMGSKTRARSSTLPLGGGDNTENDEGNQHPSQTRSATPKRRGKVIGTPRSAKRSRNSKLAEGQSPAIARILNGEDDGKSMHSPSRKELKKMAKTKIIDENLLLVERNRAMEDLQVEYSGDVRSLHDQIDALKQQLADAEADRDHWKHRAEESEANIKRGAEREWRSFVTSNPF
jgi:hypothetical protein